MAPRHPEGGFSPKQREQFHRRLMAWYKLHARKLPWRGVSDPYRTWVSEIMLQQTRVAAVIQHYQTFLHRFPTLISLALAPEEDVLAVWSGLGYYRRARMLHKAAQFIMRERAGELPSTSVELRTLPGIGDYTSAAIASIAFGESIAVVDGNVERVLLRVTGRPEDGSRVTQTFIHSLAKSLIPAKRFVPEHHLNSAGDHNQAMMELGATICLPKSPLCLQCPVYDLCKTRGEHPTLPRERQRSRDVAYLLATRKRSTATEVLLLKRAPEASLMAGMYELPPLPMDAVEGQEPSLRLRHSITNTNYYVQVYAAGGTMGRTLRRAVPTSSHDLHWIKTNRLAELPLTGLARKTLQRMKVMAVRELQQPEKN